MFDEECRQAKKKKKKEREREGKKRESGSKLKVFRSTRSDEDRKNMLKQGRGTDIC